MSFLKVSSKSSRVLLLALGVILFVGLGLYTEHRFAPVDGDVRYSGADTTALMTELWIASVDSLNRPVEWICGPVKSPVVWTDYNLDTGTSYGAFFRTKAVVDSMFLPTHAVYLTDAEYLILRQVLISVAAEHQRRADSDAKASLPPLSGASVQRTREVGK